MDLLAYIGIVVFIFFIGVGGYYLFLSLSGPRGTDEIEDLLKSGRTQAAIDELLKVLDKDDRNLRARYLLGFAYQKKGNFGASVLEFRQCLKYGKFNQEVTEVAVRTGLARSLLELKNLGDARNEYLILTNIDPKSFENFYHAGRLFFQAANYEKAINLFTKAVALNDKFPDAFNLIGQCHYHLAAYQDARAALIKATQLKPDLHVSHYFLGLCLRFLQDNEWAIKELIRLRKEKL